MSSKIFALAFFLLCLILQGKKMSHLATSYSSCCPDTYILNTTTMYCVCPPERNYLTK